ncbi:MAG: radical SAM protein [Deltaproteobacteria bacterium]|nr:radical SAM protein [Deltaproteobacteria bacterium]
MNPSCPPPVPSPPSASPTPDAAAQLTALGVRRQRRASASAGTVVPASLPEFRRYRPRAGHPDWPRLAAEAEALARALEPRLARPAGGLASLRRRAASLRTGAQNYLENRRRTRAGRHDLLPLYFIWTTLRPCNFRCTYCDDHQGGRYPELDGRGKLDTAAGRRLLEIMRTRAPSVYFAGGEPTLRKDLPALTRAARELDYFPIVTNSNGSLFDRQLARPEWASFLADTDILVISLDGLDLATLARMWVTDAPEDVVRNLLLLRNLQRTQGFKLMVNCVIQPGLTDEARAVLDLCDDLGIWFCPVPRNVGPRIDPAVPADPGYPALVAEILARRRAGRRISGSLRMNRRLLGGAPLDCRNTLKPHVDHDGHLIWPCKASVNVAPVRVNVLDFEHVDALWAHCSRLIDATAFHGPAANQCGADCNWAQNYTTDAYVDGLRHPLALLRDVVDFARA